MQKNFSVVTDATGIVHIDRQTGVMLWEQEDLDPVLKQYAKKYLVSEGFLEQALGILDPLPDQRSSSSSTPFPFRERSFREHQSACSLRPPERFACSQAKRLLKMAASLFGFARPRSAPAPLS
jgi:hypothetical protein